MTREEKERENVHGQRSATWFEILRRTKRTDDDPGSVQFVFIEVIDLSTTSGTSRVDETGRFAPFRSRKRKEIMQI
jgi:hypothetical protein